MESCRNVGQAGDVLNACDVVAELHRQFVQNPSAGLPSAADIERWTGHSVEREAELYDAIAAELARGYADGRYSFDFCDLVVNGMFGLLMAAQDREPQPPSPEVFWRVYEAFDAGEFHRREDKSDDPVADHTNPLIAAIVSEL